MRNFNAWANALPTSFATEANARRSFAKKVDGDAALGGHLVFAREDGRFSNVVINPEPAFVGWFAHNGVGVWS